VKILGIETSCDETAASIVENGTIILSNIVSSSLPLHAKTGGIIPENAARQQIKYIIPVIKKAIEAHKDFDAIAVTFGPGLIGSLLVGIETAKTLAYVLKKPIVPVNHLIGHIYANFVKEQTPAFLSLRGSQDEASSEIAALLSVARNDNIEFPAIVLIVSGGHTDLLLMKNHGNLKWLGGTRDDAAGEAFDKIARLLNLSYPGGPSIEKAAKNGNSKAFNLPRPMINSNDFDFSFSGLKTAVLREVQHHNVILRAKPEESQQQKILRGVYTERSECAHNDIFIKNIAASVQQAIIDVLAKKTFRAAQKYKVKSILLSGGVSANQALRDEFELYARRYTLDANIFYPDKNLCTDNAAMIASAAFFNYKETPWQKITVNPELYFK